jgi:hypothetical protein
VLPEREAAGAEPPSSEGDDRPGREVLGDGVEVGEDQPGDIVSGQRIRRAHKDEIVPPDRFHPVDEKSTALHGYVIRKRDRYYAVIYEGRDSVNGKERRSWHPAPAPIVPRPNASPPSWPPWTTVESTRCGR